MHSPAEQIKAIALTDTGPFTKRDPNVSTLERPGEPAASAQPLAGPTADAEVPRM